MKPTGVLMVGSVPGASPNEVLARLATALPGRLRAVPDGKTGVRRNYTLWQQTCFPKSARQVKFGGTPLPEDGSALPSFTPTDIGPTRYDEAAIESYAEFKRLRQKNIIAPNVRFQISLPSVYNVVVCYVKPELANAIEPLYEQHFAESLDRIVAKIPHDDMVIQWDLCFEMLALEYNQRRLIDPWFRPYFRSSKDLVQGLVDRIARLCERIPKNVKFGFHLCYGDLGHKHFIEPEDTRLMVELANALLARETISPRTEWLHMPVPKDRMDPDYFRPLVRLNLYISGEKPPRLYLGLVHANDEVGTKKRIQAARSGMPFPFGISTECGLARTPAGDIDSVLQICKEVTAEHIL